MKILATEGEQSNEYEKQAEKLTIFQLLRGKKDYKYLLKKRSFPFEIWPSKSYLD